MDESSEKSGGLSWFWPLFTFLSVGILLLAIAMPNRIGGGPSKISGIINNLLQIDAAKNEWALEHGFTNATQIAQLTNQLTEQDLSSNLSRGKKITDLIHPVAGEIYIVNGMSKSPEAKLGRKIDKFFPRDSIVRLTYNTNWPPYEVVSPDGKRMPY